MANGEEKGRVTWAWQKDFYWEKALLYPSTKLKMQRTSHHLAPDLDMVSNCQIGRLHRPRRHFERGGAVPVGDRQALLWQKNVGGHS